MGSWFLDWLWLARLCLLVYISLPFASAYVFAQYLRQPRPMRANPFVAFLVAGVSGFALYSVCPAAGPAHAFRDAFPIHPPALAADAVLDAGHAPRNAIPSLHLAWALLILWNLGTRKWWARAAAGIFLIFTALATLGLGEHYTIDLAVGLTSVPERLGDHGKRWHSNPPCRVGARSIEGRHPQ